MHSVIAVAKLFAALTIVIEELLLMFTFRTERYSRGCGGVVEKGGFPVGSESSECCMFYVHNCRSGIIVRVCVI